MKIKLKAVQERNWGLVIIGGIVYLIGLALVVIPIVFWKDFGWWGLLIGFCGASSMYFSGLAIKHNKPEWLLLDLILPG